MLDSFMENEMLVCWYENPLNLLPVVGDVLQKRTFGIVLERVASERGTYKDGAGLRNQSSFKALDGDEQRERKRYLDSTYQEMKIM